MPKFKVAVQVGQVMEYVVEGEDDFDAEKKAIELARKEFEADGLQDPDFDIESSEETDEDVTHADEGGEEDKGNDGDETEEEPKSGTDELEA